jgi:hypothetical protein
MKGSAGLPWRSRITDCVAIGESGFAYEALMERAGVVYDVRIRRGPPD